MKGTVMLKKLNLLINSLFRKKVYSNDCMVSTFFEDLKLADISGKENGTAASG